MKERAMMRSLLLILAAATVVAAIDAASAAPRGRLNSVVIPNNSVQPKPSGPALTSRHAPAQAQPKGQVRSQMMYSVGHINGH
jgi:hypothetical protein